MSPLGIPVGLAAAKSTGYQIGQSLRFNSADSAYLSRTPASAGNQQVFTISFWIKRSALGGKDICTGDDQNGFLINFQTGDALYLYDPNAASGGFQIWSARVFRDTSAWYHIVVAVDSTQATDSNRVKVYINGEQENLATWNVGSGASRYPTQNANLDWNNTNSHEIGTSNNYGYLDGYLAEFYNIDGSALGPDSFGKTNVHGVWTPVGYAGSYTGNSFYLKFDAADVDGDSSGLSNDFTAYNISTSGTGTDVMSDTPTTNWCTLNPLSYGPSNADMVEGNLRFNQPTSSTGNAKGTIAVSSGKWYWEVTPQTTATANVAGGILGAAETSTSSQPGNYATGYSYYSTGETRHNGVDATYGDSYGAGDVIGTALDLDAGTLVFYKNGVSQGTAFSSLSGTFVPAIGDTSTGSGSQLVCNFGQRAFEYTPPTGFKALNTSNLPAPTIKDGSKYFNTVLWTGNATARDITTGHNSNFTWIKHRNSAENHNLYDILRGVGNRLESNSKDSQTSYADRLTAFNTDGFSLGTGYNNTNTTTYVGWSWAGGGSGSSNTNGSIASTVSASSSSGFSIVSWTGEGGGANTIGHGLGDAPKMIIVKAATDNTYNWNVYHHGIDATAPEDWFISLNLTAARGGYTLANTWNRTQPTDTVFSVNSVATAGATGVTMLAYCFAEVEGYSKFGSYTGNGATTDGPFVYCGFKPAFVMWKRDGVDGWVMKDVARSPYNVMSEVLYANLSNAESSTQEVDFLSNGFKIRTNSGASNTSGNTYVFMAFASSPFGGSGVSPATAR